MADSMISARDAVTDVLDTDEFVLARAGTTKKIDGVDLRTEFGGGMPDLQWETRATNTILGVADKGKTIDITAAITQTFEADETLGDGWWVTLRNAATDSTTVVTLDMAGSETIDGATTLHLWPGESRQIFCNGAGGNFNSIMLNAGMGLYVEITSPVSITGTSAAAPNDVVSSGAVTYDGSRIKIAFYSPRIDTAATSLGNIVVQLWDTDTTDLGNLAGTGFGDGTRASIQACYVERFLTPTAASHTYKIRAYRGVANGTIQAGAGGVDTFMPAWIRITKA